MRFVRVAALAALPSLALFTTTAYAADSCWYPHEAKAAQLREFHTMLMVGALQCRTSNRFAVERYNEFVTRQRGLLDANAAILKAHFVRENGTQGGQGAYDKYATSLANGQSAKTVDPGFCSTTDTLVRIATSASHPDLLVLARSVATAPVSGPCAPSNYTATEPYQAEEASATTPVSADAAEPKAAITEAAVETAATPAVTQPATREDAMQAAIVALQSATAALQAASASGTPAPANATETVAVEDAPVVPPNETTTP